MNYLLMKSNSFEETFFRKAAIIRKKVKKKWSFWFIAHQIYLKLYICVCLLWLHIADIKVYQLALFIFFESIACSPVYIPKILANFEHPCLCFVMHLVLVINYDYYFISSTNMYFKLLAFNICMISMCVRL